MTRSTKARLLFVSVSLVLGCSSALGQDPTKIDPTIYNCAFENERVRICEITFKPGARIALHSHPDRVTYVVAGGSLAVTDPDGKTQDSKLRAGQSWFRRADSHAVINNGDTEVKLFMVELKR